jgi:AraC-like DNA-binding protein
MTTPSECPTGMPRSADHTALVRVGPLTNLPHIVMELGVPPAPLFAHHGFELTQFADPDNKISYLQGSRLLAAASVVTGRPDLGLIIAHRAEPAHLGLAGYLLLTAADVNTGLHDLLEFLCLHDQGGISFLHIDGGMAQLGYQVVEAGAEGITLIHDIAILMSCKVMRALCGENWNPDQVLLSRPRPDTLREYQRLLRAPVQFDANTNAIVFPAHWLQHKPLSANALLHRHLQQQADSLRADYPNRWSFMLRILLEQRLPSGEVTAAALASIMGVHERTLQRRLHAEGTSFHKELEALRRERAMHLLTRNHRSVEDVAAALGYAQATAFARAFKRWTGESPRQWHRRQQSAGTVSGSDPAQREVRGSSTR